MSTLARRIADLSPEKRKVLASLLNEKKQFSEKNSTIPRREERDGCPLSFAQQRLWFLDQFDPESPLYNIPAALSLEGALDVPALEKSLHAVIQRHEALRANFVERDGQPAQILREDSAFKLDFVDLQNLSPEARNAEIKQRAVEEAQRPFNLSHDPLLRATLLQFQQENFVLLLTVHHIAFDGWSTDVFLHEISTSYEAFTNGRSPDLPELPIQYADYANWQRQHLAGEHLKSQLNYWRTHLGENPPILELPTDYPRPPVQSHKGAHFRFTLPQTLYRQLNSLAHDEDVTLFMLLLAAFQVLLHRYTNQSIINIGVPVANRTHSETEGLIGFFVNTLVMSTDLTGSPCFSDVLPLVRDTAVGAYAHQDIPFEMLVEALQPERGMSHNPLFQVMFELQSAPLDSWQLGDLKLNLLQIETGLAKFDLLLTITESEESLTAEIEYNTDLFAPQTIERLAGHLQVLLAGIVADPDQPISLLPLLTEGERRQILVDWNDNTVPFPHDQCLHTLFAEQAAKSPDVTAIVAENGRLTFKELNQRANQLAHHLQHLGVGPGTLVGLCLERSTEMMIGLMGILKAGGAYLPLDPDYPPERLAYILDDAQVKVLLTQERLIHDLGLQVTDRENEEGSIRNQYSVICLDRDWATIARESRENLASTAASEDLAYVIYTSGSTGKPKGAMVPHRAALNLLTGLQRNIYDSLNAAPLRLSLNAPLPFDASVQQIVMLVRGHTLYVIPQDVRGDGEALLAYIQNNRLDVVDCVPTQLKILLEAGLLEGDGWVPTAMLPGGEAIDEETWRQLVAAPHTAFFNMYGPTECAVDSTICHVNGANAGPNIGRGIVNAQMYVLDHHLQPVPVGIPGELHIGGAGVGRGYLSRPMLTAEKFIPNPFLMNGVGSPRSTRSAIPSQKSPRYQSDLLYKTGDLVRYLPDGNIEFLARMDHQVKVRGFRIELGEIEETLRQHPDLQEVAVIARGPKTAPDENRLIAYVVSDAESTPTGSELRQFLKKKLPEYMIPSFFIPLPELPLTPNRKVDRRSLPDPEDVQENLSVGYVAPRTPQEEILAGIWAELLKLERVGIYDNFFALGGHSLLAAQLVSRIRKSLETDLALRDLFEASTIAELANLLARSPGKIPYEPLQPVSRTEPLPLSFAQQRLWFLDHLETDSPLYNIADAVKLDGPLDIMALTDSLNEVVRRHEVLRTTFATVDGQPKLQIASESPLTMPAIDLRPLSTIDQAGEIQRLVKAEAERPFDLAQGPLLRVTLLKLAETEHIILFTIHHIIADGWSTAVFINELTQLYEAFLSGKPSPLPELPVQYVDYASWQRQWLSGETLESQLAYWKKQLAGSPPLLELPTDHPRPAVQTFRGAKLSFTLPKNLAIELNKLSQQEHATLFMTLLTAFKVLLHRYSGQHDINVGTPVANRNMTEIEGLIGFFINSLVIRSKFNRELSFRELLKQVRRTSLAAYDHQDVPFEMVVDSLQPERNMSHTPLFQAMFVLQNAPVEPISLPSLTIDHLPVDSGTAKFDLVMSLTETKTGLGGTLEFNTDIFDQSTILRMVQHFERLLISIVNDPDQSVTRLPLLTQVEQRQLLVEWNNTSADYPQDQCAHQLFEAQVRQTPNAPALIFANEGQLTYQELNQRANQLAHYLKRLGVGPETFVGLCLERSLDIYVGIMGILKAGAAYVPMDPDYPRERLAFMMTDTGLPILITHSHLITQLPPNNARKICLDTDWHNIAQENDENPICDFTPENLAYVIYTSGSTGKPKGVLLEHGGLVNLATAYIRELHVTTESRVLQLFSFGFDGSVADIFTALLSGAALCTADSDTLMPGPSLAQLLREQEITTAVLPPSALSVLPQDRYPALTTLLSAGESCTREIIERWLPNRRFINAYGPTEATVAASLYPVSKFQPGVTNIPIGRPLANAHLYIFDHQRQPVPVGVPGELYIGGPGVARGYLNRPELTAERFVPNPFLNNEFVGEPGGDGVHPSTTQRLHSPSSRLYRTGDRAQYLPDGNVEFLGRFDDQVKVRGFRIELGEIEHALKQHPAIAKTAVMVREDIPGHKQLAAYLVPENDEMPDIHELKQFLGRFLPGYMIPALFTTLETLPLSPNGKVDRRALPMPDQERSALIAEFAAPETASEETLAGIWQQLLGKKQVGRNDNFFELGGDSILSIQAISRARQAGLYLTTKQLFQFPTIARLASVAKTVTPIQAEQGLVTGSVPLTPIQHWFFAQELPEPNHWNQAVRLSVRGELDDKLLDTAVARLINHHDALRLRFRRDGESWRQINAEVERSRVFAKYDFSEKTLQKQEEAIQLAANQLQASLNVSEGPLLRTAYFRLGGKQADQIIIIIHHLAVDGISWRILLEDLQTVYQQLKQGESIQLPPKTTSYKQWANQLLSYAQSDALRKELSYWANQAPPDQSVSLPLDFPSQASYNTTDSAQIVTVSLDAEETQALLEELPAAYGTEINDALLTALVQAFAGWTGSSALLLDLEGHGREEIFEGIDLSRTAGWFTTIFPVWLNLAEVEGPGNSLKAIKEQLRAVPDRGLGYSMLRYLSPDEIVKEQLQAMPKAAISFNYLGQFDQIAAESSDFSLSQGSVGNSRSPQGKRPYPLEVSGAIFDSQLRVEWMYSANLHQSATIEKIAQNFIKALQDLIDHCQKPDAGGYTPSDFPEVELSEEDIEALMIEIEDA